MRASAPEIRGTQVDVVLVVRIVQHAVELDLLDLGHGADVPGTKASVST